MQINYRHNVMDIHSVTTFARIKGGYNSGYRDVYFIRLLGGNESLKKDVLYVDNMLTKEMLSNQLLYRRITRLPLCLQDNESNYYIQCYNNWIVSDKKKMIIHSTQNNEFFALTLGRAVAQICDKYAQLKKGMSESIQKNFVIKMVWWTDFIFYNWHTKWNEQVCIKVIAQNVSKVQEYLFYYLLTLVGADVLMLQNREDINICDDLKQLSKENVLGDFAEWYLPEFEYVEDKNVSKNNNSVINQETIYKEEVKRKTVDNSIINNTTINDTNMDNTTINDINIDNTIINDTSIDNAIIKDKTVDETIINHKSIKDKEHHKKIVVHIPERKRQTRSTNARSNTNIAHNTTSTHNTNTVYNTNQTVQSNFVSASVSSNPINAAKSRKEKSFEELALLASSIVMIEVHNQLGDVLGIGSGIMIGKEGYILTNHHVVNKGWYYCVRIENDKEVYRTNEVIKYNSVMDLAVIRIAKTLSPLPIYKGRNKLVRGQRVVAIGSPLGLFNSISDGIISGFRVMDSVDVIQFTAPISHGSSGGALLNMYGEVIGISSAGIDSGQNINLAVPYDCINLFIQGFC